MENNVKNVARAKQLVNELIPMVEDAENSFKSARNWSIFDVLGGGLIFDVIKHIKLNKASSQMNEINYKLGELQQALNTITIPMDYRMEMGGFSTFGDFVFDGIIFDGYMAAKIFSSLDAVRDLKNKLYTLRSRLQ